MSDAPPAPPTARILWQRSGGDEVAFPLAGDALVVGRDAACDIVLEEPLVSRTHARLERRGGGWVVVDLGSTNLTRVNGEVVSELRLRSGDELRFARARCLFVESEAGAGPPHSGPDSGRAR